METRKIPSGDIERAAIENTLSNRPSSVSRYGEGSLSPREIKAAYDRLPRLIASYFNSFVEAVENGDVLESIPSAILDGHTLRDVISDVLSGKFSEYLVLEDGRTLSEFCTTVNDRVKHGKITLSKDSLSALSVAVEIEGLESGGTVLFYPVSRENMLRASEASLFARADEEGKYVTFTVDVPPSGDILLDYTVIV